MDEQEMTMEETQDQQEEQLEEMTDEQAQEILYGEEEQAEEEISALEDEEQQEEEESAEEETAEEKEPEHRARDEPNADEAFARRVRKAYDGMTDEQIMDAMITSRAEKMHEEDPEIIVIGGGVSAHSLPFFRELPYISRFETRKIIYNCFTI